MARYTYEYCNFPTNVHAQHTFRDMKDAPTSVVSLVEQIKNYMRNGDYINAAQILQNNKSALKPYLIDAEYMNTLDEELRNIEIYCKMKKQAYYYTDQVPDGVNGDVWIGG